ncbi:MAG: RIP metalloprotease [bacterium]|nr:RIP metalloprotease [bacterium]
MLLLLGIIMFVGLVLVHEWGHFKAARRGGVEVEEFGLGFPPKAWGKKLKSGMELSVNWLPLGGFVRLKGEHDADTTPGSYGAANLKTKVKILLAGVLMNLVTALILFTFLALIGMPQIVENQFNVVSDTKTAKQDILVAQVVEDSPAKKAGLVFQDKITTITSESGQVFEVAGADDLSKITEELQAQEVVIEYERGGSSNTTTAKLLGTEEVKTSLETDSPKGYLGVAPTQYVLNRSTWSAPVVAVGTSAQFTALTVQGIGSALGNVFSGNGHDAAQQVAGPVGIVSVIKDGGVLGYEFIVMIIAVISLTLAIMNALPIPALDGGKLWVTLGFRAFKKKLTPKIEERIHGTGFVLLILLFVLITWIDIGRI